MRGAIAGRSGPRVHKRMCRDGVKPRETLRRAIAGSCAGRSRSAVGRKLDEGVGTECWLHDFFMCLPVPAIQSHDIFDQLPNVAFIERTTNQIVGRVNFGE
jgi:hypothetical protein